jgi:hypothetical protein
MTNPGERDPKLETSTQVSNVVAGNIFAWKLTAAVLLLAALAFVGYRWVLGADALATLVELDGQPERDTATTLGQWRPAALRDTFQAGDGARTEALSEARFRLSHGATLTLKPASVVRFHRRAPNAPLRVDIEMGEVDVHSGSGATTFESEFGPLVLDEQSSVKLVRRGAQLDVEVDVGSIQLNQRAVAVGERVVLELGGIIVDVPAVVATSGADVTLAPPVASSEAPQVRVGDGVTNSDLVVGPSSTIIVHDPSPPTAVGVNVGSVCEGPARLKSGKRQTEGEGRLNLRFDVGQYSYEVSCLDAPDKVVGRGTLTVLKDTGTRRLPTFAPTANVVTDGRVYTVLYQHKLPNVSVSWPTAPSASKYTLKVGGRTFTTTTPSRTLVGLSRGKHQVTFAADTIPPRQSRVTTIEVTYDSQAPTGEVAEPPLDFAPSDSVAVRGNTLPGWSVSVDGKELAVDGQRAFKTEAVGKHTIPIVFTHPVHGTHFYLRRPKVSL